MAGAVPGDARPQDRLGLGSHRQLQHFIVSLAWDDGPLWSVLAREVDKLVVGPAAGLVIDDTALPKKREISVGMVPQYCGQLDNHPEFSRLPF